MLFLSCFCYAFCFCYFFYLSVYLCLVITCWDRADILALVCDVFVKLTLSHWYPGSGVVLDCIDS